MGAASKTFWCESRGRALGVGRWGEEGHGHAVAGVFERGAVEAGERAVDVGDSSGWSQ
jgi:hypothetical protein